jgi:hypothetical protein
MAGESSPQQAQEPAAAVTGLPYVVDCDAAGYLRVVGVSGALTS